MGLFLRQLLFHRPQQRSAQHEVVCGHINLALMHMANYNSVLTVLDVNEFQNNANSMHASMQLLTVDEHTLQDMDADVDIDEFNDDGVSASCSSIENYRIKS